MTKFYQPRILVLEGLWSDTDEIVEAAGGRADVIYPWNPESVETALRYGEWDGILLTGGSDIDPRLYNEKPHKEVYGVDHARDTSEYIALTYALEQGIPVLGICRGSQIMTAFRGGKLTQHIEGHRGGSHPVVASPEARTFTRAINSRGMDVISLHHQCVKRPGPGMRIAARAMDGTPEAVESKDGLWLGVQFHPEMAAFTNGNAFAIFQWLVRTAAAVQGKQAEFIRFRDVKRQVVTYYSSGYSRTTTVKPAKNRKAGERTYADQYVADKYTKENPCPCDISTCVFGMQCGAAWDRTSEGTEYGEPIDAPGEDVLFVCPSCAILFDYKKDRDDHLRVVHNNAPTNDPGIEYERKLTERYPELLPPAGHEAWEDREPTDDELSEIDRSDSAGMIARHVLASE